METYTCDYTCAKCGFNTEDNHIMRKHFYSEHLSKENTIECDLCDFKTNHKTFLWKHCFSEHSVFKPDEYKCSNCKFVTNDKDDFSGHLMDNKHHISKSESKYFMSIEDRIKKLKKMFLDSIEDFKETRYTYSDYHLYEVNNSFRVLLELLDIGEIMYDYLDKEVYKFQVIRELNKSYKEGENPFHRYESLLDDLKSCADVNENYNWKK